MKTRWRLLLLGLGIVVLFATVLLVGHREEPVYQGKRLSYWVTRLGSDEIHGAPKDAADQGPETTDHRPGTSEQFRRSVIASPRRSIAVLRT